MLRSQLPTDSYCARRKEKKRHAKKEKKKDSIDRCPVDEKEGGKEGRKGVQRCNAKDDSGRNWAVTGQSSFLPVLPNEVAFLPRDNTLLIE